MSCSSLIVDPSLEPPLRPSSLSSPPALLLRMSPPGWTAYRGPCRLEMRKHSEPVCSTSCAYVDSITNVAQADGVGVGGGVATAAARSQRRGALAGAGNGHHHQSRVLNMLKAGLSGARLFENLVLWNTVSRAKNEEG